MTNKSDGSTASYYRLPKGCTELQDLISHRNMNAQDGEIFRAIYRKGRASHSDELRDAKKVLFYAQAEVKRLETMATMPATFGQQHTFGPVAIDHSFNDDVPASMREAVEQREPCQPRHRCLACAGGHSTHQCGSDS